MAIRCRMGIVRSIESGREYRLDVELALKATRRVRCWRAARSGNPGPRCGCSTGWPRISFISICAACSPISRRGVATVVSGGTIWSLPGRSLKPATATLARHGHAQTQRRPAAHLGPGRRCRRRWRRCRALRFSTLLQQGAAQRHRRRFRAQHLAHAVAQASLLHRAHPRSPRRAPACVGRAGRPRRRHADDPLSSRCWVIARPASRCEKPTLWLPDSAAISITMHAGHAAALRSVPRPPGCGPGPVTIRPAGRCARKLRSTASSSAES